MVWDGDCEKFSCLMPSSGEGSGLGRLLRSVGK